MQSVSKLCANIETQTKTLPVALLELLSWLKQDSRFYYTFNKHIMFMCMLLLNTYSSLAFSLGWDMKRIGVKTITDGSRAKQSRPSLGLYRSVIDKPSSILDKHKELRET